ncbi:MAG: CBS domain-containing protein [Euryarchaeota archaeon]|nr:CBS domain-containing protein [Euryarchaeota archaeon]
MYHVRDVMTDQVVTVGKNDDLKHVMELMEKHNVTKVPVMDNGNLVGIVSDNMITKKLGSVRRRGNMPSGLHASSVMEKDFEIAHPDAPITDLLPKVGLAGLTMIPVVSKGKLVGVHTKANLLHIIESEEPVSSVMSSQVHTVTPSDRLVHARRLLIDNEIARLPVVENGKVVGILHEAEIAKAFAAMLQDTPFEHQHARARELEVGAWMRNPVVTATPDITIKEAARKMIDEQIGALPLLDTEGRITGIVTRTDLARTIRFENNAS